MAKIKIEIEIDVDFQKFFDDIPEGLFKEKEKVDDYYILDAVHGVLRNGYTDRLTNQIDWMAHQSDYYEYAEHHLKIDVEVAKQISEKAKVKIIE